MTSRGLRKYERLLLKRRGEILGALGYLENGARDPTPLWSTHPAEAASALYEREEELTLTGWLRGRLAEVDAALQRIRDGTYGRCEACGTPIERARLEAVPTARFRVECQERLEQTPQRRVGRQGQTLSPSGRTR